MSDSEVSNGEPLANRETNRELRERVRSLLTAEEWELIELREQDLSWAEIAGIRGTNPASARKQLDRALDRIRRTIQAFADEASDPHEIGCNLCGPPPPRIRPLAEPKDDH